MKLDKQYCSAVHQASGWNGVWSEYMVARFDPTPSRTLQLGMNNSVGSGVVTMWWHFVGVVL